jgi:hypothetical protein
MEEIKAARSITGGTAALNIDIYTNLRIIGQGNPY